MEPTFLTSNLFFSPPVESAGAPDLLALVTDFAFDAEVGSASGISMSAILDDGRDYEGNQLMLSGSCFLCPADLIKHFESRSGIGLRSGTNV